jgi:hypothetical protein
MLVKVRNHLWPDRPKQFTHSYADFGSSTFVRDEHGVVISKTCTKCERMLPADAFSRMGYRGHRLRSACKECLNKARALHGLTVQRGFTDDP